MARALVNDPGFALAQRGMGDAAAALRDIVVRAERKGAGTVSELRTITEDYLTQARRAVAHAVRLLELIDADAAGEL